MAAENIKGYTPLPQSIGNTDSEDEDEEHHNDDDSIKDDLSGISDATTVYENGRFYPLDETKNFANRTRNGRHSLGYGNDNIPIMILNGQNDDDLWKRRDMSPVRRFFLAFTVLLCIFTIIVFLYLIPCDTSSICPSTPKSKTSVSWDTTFDGYELQGRITVIPGNPYSLIFLCRSQQFGKIDSKRLFGQEHISLEGGGVLSIQGNSGITLWWVPLKRLPVDIDCQMIDTDGSGKPDCIVSSENGSLASIDPIAGTVHWNSEVPTHMDLPLLLLDLDSDGINDLLSIEITNSSQNLVFLSGRSGKLLARHIVLNCQSLKLVNIDSSFVLTYICQDQNTTESTRTMLLKNFIESHNFSNSRHRLASTSNPQKIIPSSYPIQSSPDIWDLTAHHRLYVKNTGGNNCPAVNCQSKVNLTLRYGANESRIWDHISDSSFVTKPAVLHAPGQAYTTGFAIKFWNWTNVDATAIKQPPSNNVSNIKPDPRRELEVRQRKLTERVSIVYVNGTEVHSMNASQSDLLQLCRGSDCQPSLPRQANSVAIADLNADGVLELVSYSSGYTAPIDNGSAYAFATKLQIVRLDAVF
ncbi:hypothetical protein QAD02_019018 [Eretmocerus hayati]|uniref:Uncharacterized protein n=1 Tax=Eretmocerus hayati TaxID=131215 RepID=A0ACC2PIF6_9HYME|nr:hypothetical protein QAD02_019018 [Eretmocerus hayati]